MMLVMMAGCWARNWFSPVPLCRIPGEQKWAWLPQPSGEHTSVGLLRAKGSDRGKRNCRKHRPLEEHPNFLMRLREL